MDIHLLEMLTGMALSGLASKPHGGGGARAETDQEIGARAVSLAKGAMVALQAERDAEEKRREAEEEAQTRPAKKKKPAPSDEPTTIPEG